MLNVHSAGIQLYESAPEQPELSIYDKLTFCLSVLIDLIIILLKSIPIFCEALILTIWRTKPKNVAGQTVLITGGANGIGKALAYEFAKKGCNIVIADIDDKSGKTTAKNLEKFGTKVIFFKTDVAKVSSLLELKKFLNENNISIDILVNNAGLMPLLSLRGGPPEDIKRIVDVNVLGNIMCVRLFLEEMIDNRRGHIITLSSMSAIHPLPGAVIYTSTKFSVTGLSLALEEELRQEGIDFIKFTILYPYFVSTRKDLMDALNLRFPAITAEYTAKIAISGILQNSRNVVIPFYDSHLVKFLRICPYKFQCLVRDVFLREKHSRKIKYFNKLVHSKEK